MDKIEKLLTEQVESNKTPSVQYLYFDQDSVIKSFQMGFADIAKKKEVDSSITYNAFSVTKTFTALAILQLYEKEYKHMLFQENKTNRGKNTGMCLSWFKGELDGNKYYASKR